MFTLSAFLLRRLGRRREGERPSEASFLLLLRRLASLLPPQADGEDPKRSVALQPLSLEQQRRRRQPATEGAARPSAAAVPQSTQTIRRAPCPTSARRAGPFGP